MWVVRQDGVIKSVNDTENDAWLFVLKAQGQSVDYALTHGGWTIEEE